jgi:hypothetical protein
MGGRVPWKLVRPALPGRPVVGDGWYRVAVALRREDLNAEQLERQQALDRSWVEAQRGLADPEFRAYLEDSIRRLDAKEPAPLLTREEFLAQTVLDE